MRLAPIAGVLAAHDVARLQWTHRLEDLGLFRVHRTVVPGRGGFHRQQRHDLKEMVLHDITQAARRLVERAAAIHAELLGEGHLDAGDVVAVPYGLEEGVGEAKIENVHDRLLPQIMVDPEDRIFRKQGARDGVELARGGQVATERFLHDHPRLIGEAGSPESLDHGREQRRGDREIVRRPSRPPQLALERREGQRVVVVAGDVPEERQESAE